MTTDNQTIENPDFLKDLDIYCQVREKAALEGILSAWYDFRAGQDFLSYCKQKFSNDKRKAALKTSGYSLSELPEVESTEVMEFTRAISNLNKDEFDILVMSVTNGLTDWQNCEKRAKNNSSSLHANKKSCLVNLQNTRDSDLKTLQDARDSNLQSLQDSKDSNLSSLQKSQSSDLTSAKQRLEACLYSIESKKSEITDLQRSLATESLFLVVPLFFGAAFAGFWGAIIALAVVSFFRIGAS